MKKAILLTSLIGISSVAFANVDIKSLELYKNRTFVNQKLDVLSNSVDLISKVRFEDIRFVVDGDCKINNTSVISKNYSMDNLSNKIDKNKKDIALVENEIKSISNTIESLESIRFQEEAVNLENIKKVTLYTRNEIQNSYNKLFDLNIKVKKLKDNLNILLKKKNSNIHSKLEYNATCLSGSSISVNYPVYNIRQNSFYEVDVDSKNSEIEIKNSAYITQSTGYDFKNVDLSFYTYNYSNQIKPRPFYPKYLDVYEPPVAYNMQADEAMIMERVASVKKSKMLKPTPRATYNETQTKSFFKVSAISLKSGIKTPVSLVKEKFKSTTSIEIDGFSSSKPFYKVEFKSDKLFSSSSSKLYLDSVYIGETYQNEIKKDKETSIYLAEDRFIDIKKELLKDMKEKPFFSVDKIKTEKLWKYTITNNHKSKKTITLVERLPISKHEDIKVKLISKTKYDSKDDNGKISYDFVLEPNEKKIIEFGYEVEKPYKK